MVALREPIAILSDPLAVDDIRQSEADVLAGRTANAEELRSAMLSRRPTHRVTDRWSSWRVVYRIDDAAHTVYVLSVRLRGDVYGVR